MCRFMRTQWTTGCMTCECEGKDMQEGVKKEKERGWEEAGLSRETQQPKGKGVSITVCQPKHCLQAYTALRFALKSKDNEVTMDFWTPEARRKCEELR